MKDALHVLTWYKEGTAEFNLGMKYLGEKLGQGHLNILNEKKDAELEISQRNDLLHWGLAVLDDGVLKLTEEGKKIAEYCRKGTKSN